ncbi:MAG: hypothetical protein IJ337_09505 [Clostridia bacterium]|nr:hypothetical protein [Clostridia bacterium]
MRIRTRISFYVYLLLIAMLSSPGAVLAALCALAVHESGHMIAARLIKEPIVGIECTPFGGVLHYAAGKSASKGLRGIAAAAAGPAANYFFLLLLGCGMVQEAIGSAMAEKLIVANASMLLLNLLPVLPLDGGRIVLSAGFYVFSVSALIRVLCALGCAAGVGLILLAFWGFAAYGVLNCSLVIIGAYLIGCSYTSRDALMYENTYAVIKERQDSRQGMRRAQVYLAKADTKLHALFPALSRAQAAIFICEHEDGNRCIFESAVLSAMLDKPAMTLGDLSGLLREKEQSN